MIQENQLFEGERIITRSDGDTLVLTNKRIRYTDRKNRQLHVVSILLANVQSIDVMVRSKLPYLFVSLALVYISLFFGNGTNLVLLGFAMILMFYYFTTIKHVCTIHAGDGDPISFKTSLMKDADLLKFINQVEESILTK